MKHQIIMTISQSYGLRFKNFAEGNQFVFQSRQEFHSCRWSGIRVEGTKLKGRLHLAPEGVHRVLMKFGRYVAQEFCVLSVLVSVDQSRPRDGGQLNIWSRNCLNAVSLQSAQTHLR